MKYVLLNAAFTVLHAFDAIGHRPLTDVERLGYFHAQVNMGQAMQIQELTHSWDEMSAWFDKLNRALAFYTPYKRRLWASIEQAFDRAARVPNSARRVSSAFSASSRARTSCSTSLRASATDRSATEMASNRQSS